MELRLEGWRAISEFPTLFEADSQEFAVGVMLGRGGRIGIGLADADKTRILAEGGVDAINVFDYHLRGSLDEPVSEAERKFAIRRLREAAMEPTHDEPWLRQLTKDLMTERQRTPI